MSHAPIRLALIGCRDSPALWRDIALRLRGACWVLVSDSDATRADAMAQAVGASVAVESIEDAMESHGGDFDAIVMNASLSGRPALRHLVMAAGKHLMVNAPVSGMPAEVESLVDACGQQGVCLAARETQRFTPSVQVIKDRLASGKLGDPGLLRVHRWRSKAGGRRPLLAETLFADVDLALWLFNARPTEVYALARGGEGDRGETPDYLQIHFGFPLGAMALLDFSATLPAGRGYESLSLIGSSGAAYADDHHNTHLLFAGGNPAALIMDQGRGYLALELQSFVDAIQGKTEPPVGPKDCLAVHRVLEAIGRSLSTKQVLRVRGETYV